MSDYSDDEWEDVLGPAAVAKTPAVESQIKGRVERAPSESDLTSRFAATPLPTRSQDQLLKLGELVPLDNFHRAASGPVLYRCEPAAKKYPGFTLSAKLCAHPYLWVTVELLNGSSKASMRTPDIKTRDVWHCRRESGVLIRTDALVAVHFKKKCVHKQTGKDMAFELGKNFESHTAGVTPLFVFVVVPFDGRFRHEDAVRSPPFQVLSKRQDRFLQSSNKRRKRNNHLDKLDTDIASAQRELQKLQAEKRRLNTVSAKFRECFGQIQSLIPYLNSETARLALDFALRDEQVEDSASF